MEISWLVFAFLFGLLAQLFKIPILVGYLAAGFFLSIFGAKETELLKTLSELGVTLLLFTVGLHLRVKNFLRPEVFFVGLIHISFFFSICLLILWSIMGVDLINFAIALTFSSTVVAAKGFESAKTITSLPARVAIGVLILQDIVAVKVISQEAVLGLNTLSILLLIPLLFFIRAILDKNLKPELILLSGVVYALVSGHLFQYAGLSIHIGAIVAGISLASHKRAQELSYTIWSLKELLLIALFLSIGLYGFPSLSLFPFILIFLSLLPIKFFIFFFLFTTFRLRARSSFLAALSLTCYSEFCLVVAYYLEKNNQLNEDFVSAAAILTSISFAICSYLMARGNYLWERFEYHLIKFEKSGHTIDKKPTSFGAADVLIVGMGESGGAAYDRALEIGFKPVGIDSDINRVQSRIAEEKRVIHSDSQDGSFWAEAHLDRIKAIIFCLPDYQATLDSVFLLKKRRYIGQILALARDSLSAQKFKEAGVMVSVVPMIESGRELAEQVNA